MPGVWPTIEEQGLCVPGCELTVLGDSLILTDSAVRLALGHNPLGVEPPLLPSQARENKSPPMSGNP